MNRNNALLFLTYSRVLWAILSDSQAVVSAWCPVAIVWACPPTLDISGSSLHGFFFLFLLKFTTGVMLRWRRGVQPGKKHREKSWKCRSCAWCCTDLRKSFSHTQAFFFVTFSLCQSYGGMLYQTEKESGSESERERVEDERLCIRVWVGCWL